MTEPKPCPFCGELPKLFDKRCYYYQCVKEKCRGQEMSWNNTIEEALASWNTRPIEEALRARIEKLEAEEWEPIAPPVIDLDDPRESYSPTFHDYTYEMTPKYESRRQYND